MESKKINRVLVILTLVLVFTPLFFSFFKPIKLKELSGAYNLPDTVGFNSKNWHTSEFQQKFNQFYEYQVGLRPLFIRLRNQFAFTFFGQSTSYVTIGKEKNLYTWGYLDAYKGLTVPNEKSISDSVSYILALEEALRERGVKLVVIIAPNKVRSFPDILNEKDAALPLKTTFYDLYLKKLTENGVAVIDMNSWFASQSKQSKYPLFPSTGIHWSTYGSFLAADSIVKYLSVNLSKDLLQYKVSNYEKKSTPDHSEIDLMKDLNLLFDFYPNDLVYPILNYTNKEKESKYKPNVWVISDSFYWNLFGLGLQENHFSSQSEFWFYGNTAYGNGEYEKPTIELNIEERLKGKEVVILMATEANLHQFPYGFIQKMNPILNLNERVINIAVRNKARVLELKSQSFFNEVINNQWVNANLSFLPKSELEYLMKLQAYKAAVLEMYQTEKEQEIQSVIERIKFSKEWMKQIEDKAKLEKKQLDQSIVENAEYIYFMEGRKKLMDKFDPKFSQLILVFEDINQNKEYVQKIEEESKTKKLPNIFNFVGHIDYIIDQTKK